MIRESRRISIGLSAIVILALALAASPVLAQTLGTLELPDPDFTADRTSGYAPLEVHFTDLTDWGQYHCASGSVLDVSALAELLGVDDTLCEWHCTWDFGDGSTYVGDMGDDPTHVYTRSGRYDVTLTWETNCVAQSTFVPPAAFLGRPNRINGEEAPSVTKKMYITVLGPEEELDRPPEPARMLSAHLDVNPTAVVPGQEVLVSANVCNSGGESGVKTATLFVNGTAEQSQTVGVGPGGCTTVVFRIYKGAPGTYQVNVDGMQGQFSVVAPRIVQKNVPSQQDTGIGTAGIVAIVAVLIVLILAVVVILKKE